MTEREGGRGDVGGDLVRGKLGEGGREKWRGCWCGIEMMTAIGGRALPSMSSIFRSCGGGGREGGQDGEGVVRVGWVNIQNVWYNS